MVGYDVFSLTRIGERHLLKGTPCQDSSSSARIGGAVAICVSDGHGASDYFRSDKGSLFACEAFMEFASRAHGDCHIPDLSASDRKSSFFRSMDGFILSLWHEKINADLKSHPIEPEERARASAVMESDWISENNVSKAYGATLIGAVIAKGYCYGIQIGDGELICISEDGVCLRPVPEDNRCVGSITTSLCDNKAINEFRHFFSQLPMRAVFAATDGVDKSFGIDQTDQLDAFYGKIVSRFQNNGRDAATEELQQFLPNLSKKGSGDDISVSGAVRRLSFSQRLFKGFKHKD